MSKQVAISLQGLTIGYGTKVVQRDLTLSLEQGEMVCMLGRNGCGKSTLLRTLAGLQPALGGVFSIQQSAVVLTDKLTLENTTVRDVVAMGRYPYTSFLGKLTAEDEQVIDASLLEVFSSQQSAISNQPFNALSDGEKQRVLIAKALAQ